MNWIIVTATTIVVALCCYFGFGADHGAQILGQPVPYSMRLTGKVLDLE
jgi:hypothetical protein